MAELKKKNGVSSWLLYFLLGLTIAASAVMLLPVYRDYKKKEAELNQLTEKLNELKEVNNQLSNETRGLQNSPDQVEKVAREKFGLVKEGEGILKYQMPRKQ